MKFIIALAMLASTAFAGTEVIYSAGPDKLLWDVEASFVIKKGVAKVQVYETSSRCRTGGRCYFKKPAFSLEGLYVDRGENTVSFKGTNCGKIITKWVGQPGRYLEPLTTIEPTGLCEFEVEENNNKFNVLLHY